MKENILYQNTASYLKAEYLKCKRTILNQLIWLAPFFTAFFSLLVGGFSSYQCMLFYWWYAFLLSGTIAIFCWLSVQKEKRAGKYVSLFSLPIDLAKLERAKSIVIVQKLLAAAIFLAVFASLTNVISPQMTIYSVWQNLYGSIAIVTASIWQIPLCFYLSRKFGLLLPVLFNTAMGLAVQILMETSLIGWQFPYCWPAKTAEILLGIKMNGTYGGNPVYSHLVIVIMALSVLLFWGLTWLDAKEFAKERGA